MIIGLSDSGQVQLRCVVEGQSELRLYFPVQVSLTHAFGIELGGKVYNLVLSGSQDALETAQDSQRKDVVAVVLGLNDGAQVLVGGVPHDGLI